MVKQEDHAMTWYDHGDSYSPYSCGNKECNCDNPTDKKSEKFEKFSLNVRQ